MNTHEENPGAMGAAADAESAPPGAPSAPPGPPPAGWPNVPPPAAAAYAGYTRPRRKSVALACLLSFFMPGLGQVYLGYYQRGFLHAIVFAALVTMMASGNARGMEPLVGISMGFWYLYNIVDAGRRASLYNLAVDGLRAPEFPKDFKMPDGRGSLIGGAFLVFFGIMFLLDIHYGIDMDWLADWWPLFLVGLGAWLMYKNIRARGSK